MKTKIFVSGLVCLFLSSFTFAQDDFGSTGKFYQITLKKLPPPPAEMFIDEEETDEVSLPVKTLMAGIKKFS